MVLDVKKEEKKLLLGYRQTLENPWDTIASRFPVGSVHKKKIRKMVKFGFFVELENDIDGLVHVSDLSWDENRKQLLGGYSVGQEVEFKILDIRKDEMKISCGVKQLQKSPWDAIAEKYRPRMPVKGVISGITQFGLFVKLEENVEGLVHISEVSSAQSGIS
jgi:small subunit ribosomal protein S1